MVVLVHAVSTIVLVLVLLVLDIQSALIGGCTIIQSTINRLQSINQLIELIINSAQSCIFFTVLSRLQVLVDIVVGLAVVVRDVNFSIRENIIRV